jgi:hypothetical protein
MCGKLVHSEIEGKKLNISGNLNKIRESGEERAQKIKLDMVHWRQNLSTQQSISQCFQELPCKQVAYQVRTMNRFLHGAIEMWRLFSIYRF